VDDVSLVKDVVLPIVVTVVGTVASAWIVAGFSVWWTRRKSAAASTKSWLALASLKLRRHWRPVALVAVAAASAVILTIILPGMPISNEEPLPSSATPSSTSTPLPLQTLLPKADDEVTNHGAARLAATGWGPERNIVSSLSRNSRVVLNSMIDNPVHGDERNFAQVRAESESNSEYSDQMVVEPGAVYVAYFYFSNDAAPSEDAHAAEDVRLSVQAPGVFKGSAAIYGVLSSSNADPSEVWDGFTLALGSPDSEAALRYVTDSATIHVNGAVDGKVLNETELFSGEGARLGCDALDGRVPSAARCSGYVTLRLRVDQPNFVVTAEARLKGSNDPWLDHVEAAGGDVIEVRAIYQNTGSSQQDDVSIRADLPSGLRYIEESTFIANSKTGGAYRPTLDGISTTGKNVGSYSPRGNVYLKFDVIVDTEAIPEHSTWLFVPNIVRATTSGGYKEAPLTIILLN
jgi:hypothetical protein